MKNYIFLVEDFAEDTENWYLLQNCYSEEDAKNKFVQKFLPYVKFNFDDMTEMFYDKEIHIRCIDYNLIKSL